MTTTGPRSSGNEMQNEPMNRTIRTVLFGVPSGKRYKKTMENHHFQWVNQLFRLGHFP